MAWRGDDGLSCVFSFVCFVFVAVVDDLGRICRLCCPLLDLAIVA